MQPRYLVQDHRPAFFFSLHFNQLSLAHQEVMLDWSRHLDRDERHNYHDGSFYVVLPFERILAPEALSHAALIAFHRRLERLDFVGDTHKANRHIDTFPDKGWLTLGQTVDTYIDMLLLMHDLRAALPESHVAANTFAIYVEF